jgi:hypothetical protein
MCIALRSHTALDEYTNLNRVLPKGWNTSDRGSDYAASEVGRKDQLSYVGQVGSFQGDTQLDHPRQSPRENLPPFRSLAPPKAVLASLQHQTPARRIISEYAAFRHSACQRPGQSGRIELPVYLLA